MNDEVIVGMNQQLEWRNIQEMIDWNLENDFNFQRSGIFHGQGTNLAVKFWFDNPAHALMFKLRWGGM